MIARFLAVILAFTPAFLSAAGPTQDAPDVEVRVMEMAKQPGLTVVHLWATWCPNCSAEMQPEGWPKFIAANPKTQFVFVTVWDGGKDGREQLAKAGIAAQPNVTILAHPGDRRENKIKSFAGLPLSWIPSTWVYQGGKLNYALNFGEVRFTMLQQMVDDCTADWSHK